MNEEMTKTKLINTLREKRAEWDAALAAVPENLMTQPGAAGEWSVKDIIAHINHFERWYADRLHETLRGEVYEPTELDRMQDIDEQNQIIYEQNKNRPLAEVLTESKEGFQRLMEGVLAHPESFLLEPHDFGAPEPIVIWKNLRGDIYDHYAAHIPSIQQWAQSQQNR